MDILKKYIAQIGARRLAIIGGSGLAALIVISLLTIQLGTPKMAYLYTDLDPDGARLVTETLRGQAVPFELSPDGTAVLAPAARISELRMDLAGKQIGGKVGYEVLDSEEPFGTSAARAKLNETRAIEGELSRSIESLQSVRRARVHLVMPERQLFATESRPASAAITIQTAGRLSNQQTDAIRYLVAAAVPELSPDRISIVDQNGTLLARIGDGESGAGSIDERERTMEARMRADIEAMLERIVGPGHARAQVAVELDRRQTREESDLFDPDRQVVAKTTSVETSDEANENSSAGETSVAAQLPENQEQANLPGDMRRSSQREISEETTYDNSRVRTTSIRPGGALRRITVSVMVDGSYTTATDGARSYTPRSPLEIERLTRLVENAVGFDQERGDRVVVESMRFAPLEDVELEGSGLLFGGDVMGLLTTLGIGILVLVGMGMLLRAWRRGRVRTAEPMVAEAPLQLDASNIDPTNLTAEMRELLARAAAGDDDAMHEFVALQEPESGQPALDHEIDIVQVHGRLKASVLRRVGDVVRDKTPEAAAVIRQWMTA